MIEITKFYEKAKQSAKNHMKNGQIHAYYQDLKAMNHYKRLIEAS